MLSSFCIVIHLSIISRPSKEIYIQNAQNAVMYLQLTSCNFLHNILPLFFLVIYIVSLQSEYILPWGFNNEAPMKQHAKFSFETSSSLEMHLARTNELFRLIS